MEQIRKDIADRINLRLTSSRLPINEELALEIAGGILNDITLRRGGGVCDECNGQKEIRERVSGFLDKVYNCPKCKGTGKLPVEEKSIKEILGGWLDGHRG